jgi:hypothetical protein
LEWDDESQKWSWPPTADYRLFQSTIDKWETVLRVLAEGPIEDASGYASTVLREKAGFDVTQSSFSKLQLELETLGLVKRDVRGRKTFHISLAVPVEQPTTSCCRGAAQACVAVEAFVSGGGTLIDAVGASRGVPLMRQRTAARRRDAGVPQADNAELIADVNERQRGDKLAEEEKQHEDRPKLLANQKGLRFKLGEAERKARQLDQSTSGVASGAALANRLASR